MAINLCSHKTLEDINLYRSVGLNVDEITKCGNVCPNEEKMSAATEKKKSSCSPISSCCLLTVFTCAQL